MKTTTQNVKTGFGTKKAIVLVKRVINGSVIRIPVYVDQF